MQSDGPQSGEPSADPADLHPTEFQIFDEWPATAKLSAEQESTTFGSRPELTPREDNQDREKVASRPRCAVRQGLSRAHSRNRLALVP
jgi:hypothetical protein